MILPGFVQNISLVSRTKASVQKERREGKSEGGEGTEARKELWARSSIRILFRKDYEPTVWC